MADDRPMHEIIEIEITSEMVEAGALAFAKHSDLFESTEEAVIRVFLSMIEASGEDFKIQVKELE
jgi:hypothetical protein